MSEMICASAALKRCKANSDFFAEFELGRVVFPVNRTGGWTIV